MMNLGQVRADRIGDQIILFQTIDHGLGGVGRGSVAVCFTGLVIGRIGDENCNALAHRTIAEGCGDGQAFQCIFLGVCTAVCAQCSDPGFKGGNVRREITGDKHLVGKGHQAEAIVDAAGGQGIGKGGGARF